MKSIQNIEEDLKISDSKIDSSPLLLKKGFVEKKLESLKWFISVYHIFFAIWAIYNLLKVILPSISNLIYTIPLIIFIVSCVIGSLSLLKGRSNAYNILIIVQILQVIVLQLNGFVYFLLIGQWVIFRIGSPQLFGIDFGILNAKYAFTFISAKEDFLFGINIIPIILIFILLKLWEIEDKNLINVKSI